MDLFLRLQELMLKYRFRPERAKSEYYCIDEKLVRKAITELKLSSRDVVLELNPGPGLTTRILLEKSSVIALEQNKAMVELLEKEFSSEISEKKLQVIFYNPEKQSLKEFKANKLFTFFTTPDSTLFLKNIYSSNAESAVLLLEDWFLEKAIAFEGLEEYSPLPVFVELNSKVTILEKHLQSKKFFPAQSYFTTLIKVDFHRENISEDFYNFLKEMFRYKNKDLIKAIQFAEPELKKQFKLSKTKQEKLINYIQEKKLDGIKLNLISPKKLDLLFQFILK